MPNFRGGKGRVLQKLAEFEIEQISMFLINFTNCQFNRTIFVKQVKNHILFDIMLIKRYYYCYIDFANSLYIGVIYDYECSIQLFQINMVTCLSTRVNLAPRMSQIGSVVDDYFIDGKN